MNTTIWSWLGPTDIDLTPGLLDAAAREAFTSGQCHALALAIHDLTGWELGGLSWADDGDELPDHVVVRRPDGLLLDVKGEPDPCRWGDDFRPLTREEVTDWLPTVGYLEPDLDAGREFAPLVLRTYAADLVPDIALAA